MKKILSMPIIIKVCNKKQYSQEPQKGLSFRLTPSWGFQDPQEGLSFRPTPSWDCLGSTQFYRWLLTCPYGIRTKHEKKPLKNFVTTSMDSRSKTVLNLYCVACLWKCTDSNCMNFASILHKKLKCISHQSVHFCRHYSAIKWNHQNMRTICIPNI